jgi:hypothetical protein
MLPQRVRCRLQIAIGHRHTIETRLMIIIAANLGRPRADDLIGPEDCGTP